MPPRNCSTLQRLAFTGMHPASLVGALVRMYIHAGHRCNFIHCFNVFPVLIGIKGIPLPSKMV